MEASEKNKKGKVHEQMETGDTGRSGTLTGTPPEYRRTAPYFLSQVAPPGSVLAEPHEASVEGQLLVVCSSPTLAGAQLMSIAFYRRPTRVGW